jgi:hypothetical protein
MGLMPIKNERFAQGDVYIDYDYEQVMFRYEFSTRKFYRRFYGEKKESEVRFDNGLLNQAICSGVEIDRGRYYSNKPKVR